MSFSYSLSSTSRGRGDDVTSFPPEMDDAMMEDRLEQARLNRTNYYRRMLASRTRPMEDHLVSRKSTSYTSGGSGGGGGSISDTAGTVPVPKIPEPHCSWRFYTSYDNGEWKRHAVPVDHDVDEILREPTKTPRRERDKVSPPPSASLETSSSIRRARQAGGPLMACLQPRVKRTSESSGDGVTGSRVVGLPASGVGQAINGLDAQFAGQLGPAELMSLCGNEELVRQILEGGGLVAAAAFDGENLPTGQVKQEYSSKYMTTVTTTQPATGGVKNPGAQGEGGAADVAKMESDGAGVQKSRRPRIYGFQEKIIIPTKYKTSVASQENDVTTAKTDSMSRFSGSKVNQDAGNVNGVLSSGTDDVKTETRAVDRLSTLRSSPGRTRTSPESQKVKVVVVNSGSDVESDRRSEERKEAEAEEEKEQKKKKEEEVEEGGGGELAEVVQKEPGKRETFAPFVLQEGLTPMENFQAFQDNFRRQFENASVEKNDGGVEKKEKEEEKGGSASSSHPGQRLFSKDEQTFSDVSPDGQKRDGKVVRTYEVVTTTDGDPSPARGDEGPLSVKQISITPVGAVRSQLAAIPITPAERRRSNDGAVEIVREDGARGTSPFGGGGGGHRSVKIIRDAGSNHPAGGTSPLASRRTVVEQASFSSSPKSEERRGVRPSGGDVSIFDQTGSLFKQISPRPRAEREREFASPRDTRQWSRDQGAGGGGGGGRGGGGGYTGRAAATTDTTTTTATTATRTWTDGSADQPQVARRKVVIVREMDTGGGTTEGTDSEGTTRSACIGSQKTVETVREGDGKPAGHHHPDIVFREPDGKTDKSSARTTVKIVREYGGPSGAGKTTSWETGSGISSLEDASSFGERVLYASSSSKGKDNPDPDPGRLSGFTTEQSSRTGDKDASGGEHWEVQVAVKN